jgi:hypothetical protein
MGRRSNVSTLFVVLALWTACSSRAHIRSDFNDVGKVCLQLRGSSLEIRVDFPTCLSSSCDRALETSCKVEVSGSALMVTSHGASETTGASECTTDCGILSATCSSTDAVAPGEYALTHGKDSTQVTLSAQQTCVFGSGG